LDHYRLHGRNPVLALMSHSCLLAFMRQEYPMLDYFTADKVDVRLDKNCGAYIMIAPARIDAVKELLQ
jgi:hypothetical protein